MDPRLANPDFAGIARLDERKSNVMQAYVVNLARSPDRRAHMVAQLAKTEVHAEIVEAIDGRDLDLGDTRLFDTNIVGTSMFRRGAAGCALSHLKVYRKVLDGGHDSVLVLEDDIMLPGDLNALINAAAQEMTGASVVLLNFHSGDPCRIIKTGSVSLPSSRLLVRVFDEGQPSSTGAYLITREACARMVTTVLPLRAQPDDWGFFHKEGAIDDLRCVVPMPITNSATLRSTIDYYRPGSPQARLREAVARGRVPLVHQALALRRRRTFRRLGWTGRTEFVEERPGVGGSRFETH
jgi:glycosyl transferase family 25